MEAMLWAVAIILAFVWIQWKVQEHLLDEEIKARLRHEKSGCGASLISLIGMLILVSIAFVLVFIWLGK